MVNPAGKLANTRLKLAGTTVQSTGIGNQLTDPGAEQANTASILLDPVGKGLATVGQLGGTSGQRRNTNPQLLDTIVDLADPGNVLVNPVVQGHDSAVQLFSPVGGTVHPLADHVEFLEHSGGIGVSNRCPDLGVQLLHPHLGNNLTDHVQ